MRWFLVALAAMLGLAAWLAFRREEAPGRGVRLAVVDVAPPEEATAPPEAEEKAPPLLHGRVLDRSGRPLFRAQVVRVSPGGRQSVFADPDGRFSLPLTDASRHVVEAFLGDEYVADRRVIVGLPEGTEFRLRPAGFLYGHVEGAGGPADHASVDLFDEARNVGGTETVGGQFVILDEPPKDVPLKLHVHHAEDGYLVEPLDVAYRGEPIDLGTIRLTRFSKVTIRLVRHDGKQSGEPRLFRPESVRYVGWNQWSGVPAPDFFATGEHRIAAVDQRGDCGVVGTVRVLRGEDAEVAFDVPRGPLPVSGRVVDPEGKPALVRLRHGRDGEPARTGDDGRFRLQARYGGLIVLEIDGVRPAGHDWIDASRSFASFVVDTDAPPPTFTLAMDRRIILVSAGRDDYQITHIDRSRTSGVWYRFGPGTVDGVDVSPALAPGRYRVNRRGFDGYRAVDIASGEIEVPEKGFVVFHAPR